VPNGLFELDQWRFALAREDLGAMRGGVRKKSELGQRAEIYGSAYKLAWKQIPLHKRRADLSLRIHASIRRQLKDGAKDPIGIASEAVKDALGM